MFRSRFPLSSALLCGLLASILVGQSPTLPVEDPIWEGASIELSEGIGDAHPRLLFDRAKLQRVRDYYLSVAGGALKTDLEAYLPACVIPDEPSFLTNATDGQRQGLWRMPTVALHYQLTNEAASRDRVIAYLEWLNGFEHWEMSREIDCGMSAANIMIGAAIGFDAVYADLDTDFRETFRRKLWHHARSMYYYGHRRLNPETSYWTADGQNNHRWHRNAGMVLCALAAANGDEEQQWLLGEIREELDFIVKWLPDDGTTHESPSYMVFGIAHLMLALDASDRCLGSTYLQDSAFFRNLTEYRAQTVTPGIADAFQYGDSDGLGAYNAAFYLAAAAHRQSDHQALLDTLRKNVPKAFEFAWMTLVWRDSTIPTGSTAALAHCRFFEDLGLLTTRDGWETDNVAMMFKCGPLGGHLMNTYRDEHQLQFVNVAHDDPDANMFTLWADGAFLAENDRYSKHKRSSNHNTVLVDGLGQTARGQAEGMVWSQPASNRISMEGTAYITARYENGPLEAIEGEASGAYSHTQVDRYRRAVVWNEGKYVLVIDDLRAPEPHEFTWLMQGAELSKIEELDNFFRLTNGKASAPFMVRSNQPIQRRMVESTADHRGKLLGWQQLQVSSITKAWKVVSLYLPWAEQADFEVDFDTRPTSTEIRITTSEGVDIWTWQAAPDNAHSSHLALKTKGVASVLFAADQRITPSAR